MTPESTCPLSPKSGHILQFPGPRGKINPHFIVALPVIPGRAGTGLLRRLQDSGKIRLQENLGDGQDLLFNRRL